MALLLDKYFCLSSFQLNDLDVLLFPDISNYKELISLKFDSYQEHMAIDLADPSDLFLTLRLIDVQVYVISFNKRIVYLLSVH